MPQSLPPLVLRLQQAEEWRDSQGVEIEDELESLQRKQGRLQHKIDALTRELNGVSKKVDALQAQVDKFDQQQAGKIRQAMSEALQAENAIFHRQADAYDRAWASRMAMFEAELATEESRALLDELDQLKDYGQAIESMPDGFQKAIREQSQRVDAQLAALFARATAPLPGPAEREAISLVCMVEGDESGAVLRVLLPVAEGVHHDFEQGHETLQAHLVLRLASALGAACQTLACRNATSEMSTFEGMFLLSLLLPDKEPGDVKQAVGRSLDHLRANADELTAAGLEMYTVWLSPEVFHEA